MSSSRSAAASPRPSFTIVAVVAGALALGAFAVPRARAAIINPEICDNCFDDDGNHLTDREDTAVCKAPANGNDVGLSDASAAKGAVKCQKAIEKASFAFALKKLGRLNKCLGLAFSCVQLKNGDQACIDKATAACDKQVQAIPGDEAKAKAAIEKACDDSPGGSVSSPADILDVTGLGFSAEEGFLNCPATIVTSSDLADCVIDRHECGVERVALAVAPRAQELLVKLGHNVATEFPCLAAKATTQGDDGGGLGLADAVQAKAAVKCQGAILKAASKFGRTASKNVQKCVDMAATCIQLKPGVPSCEAKATTTCQKGVLKQNAFDLKLFTGAVKSCTTPAFGLPQMNAAAGLGFGAVTDPDKRCSQFTFQAPDGTEAQLMECMGAQYGCDAAYLIEREVPRLREYAAFANVSLHDIGF